MTNDMVTLTLDQTVREALLRLREHLKQTDFTHFLYVVESEASRLLRGTTTLQELIVADDERRLNEIMNIYVMTLDPWNLRMPERIVCSIVTWQRCL